MSEQQPMTAADQQQAMLRAAALTKSYTGPAILALLLSIFLWPIGFIYTWMLRGDLKRMEKLAGSSLSGGGCIGAVFWFNLLCGLIWVGVIALFVNASNATSRPTTSSSSVAPAAVPTLVAAAAQPTAPTQAQKAAAQPTNPPPTAEPKAPAATPTEWLINGMPVKTSDCKISQVCITTDLTSAVIVNEVVLSDKSGNDFIKPTGNNTYLFVNVIIGNFGKGPVAYNPLYAKVKDGSGREYQTNIMAGASLTGSLQNGNLAPNDKVQGIIAFEVPKGSSGFKFSYQPIVFPQPAPVVIDLGQ